MQKIIDDLPKLAKDTHYETKKFFAKLRKKPPKKLDDTMERLHTETFEKIDCLECGNCCKTTGPLFINADVKRISKYLKIKPGAFETQYLRRDEDDDLVLKKTPCAFLADDNYCMIYDVRPKACSEFPHTNQKKFQQITDLTLENVAICPAAFTIVEKMKASMFDHKEAAHYSKGRKRR